MGGFRIYQMARTKSATTSEFLRLASSSNVLSLLRKRDDSCRTNCGSGGVVSEEQDEIALVHSAGVSSSRTDLGIREHIGHPVNPQSGRDYLHDGSGVITGRLSLV